MSGAAAFSHATPFRFFRSWRAVGQKKSTRLTRTAAPIQPTLIDPHLAVLLSFMDLPSEDHNGAKAQSYARALAVGIEPDVMGNDLPPAA